MARIQRAVAPEGPCPQQLFLQQVTSIGVPPPPPTPLTNPSAHLSIGACNLRKDTTPPTPQPKGNPLMASLRPTAPPPPKGPRPCARWLARSQQQTPPEPDPSPPFTLWTFTRRAHFESVHRGAEGIGGSAVIGPCSPRQIPPLDFRGPHPCRRGPRGGGGRVGPAGP